MITVSIETYIDVFEHDFNRLVHVWQTWSSGHFHSFIWIRRCYHVSGLYFKCLDGELRTYREHFASYLRNIIQRIRNVLHVTGRRWYNIPGASFKVLEEAVTTCHERLASYLQKISRVASHLKKMLQRIRNIWQVTWRKVYDVSGRSCKLLTSRKMLHVAGTSCMLLDEDATTYKDHHSSYLKKMWQRARNVLQVTCRRFHNVSGTCCKSLEEGWWFEYIKWADITQELAGICLMDYLLKYKQVPFWSPTQHVPAQTSPSAP